uniref:Uncharacterized protein n=1 Tax=Strigamia maritima TaxID=126957 RepID=T1IST1_STRMM
MELRDGGSSIGGGHRRLVLCRRLLHASVDVRDDGNVGLRRWRPTIPGDRHCLANLWLRSLRLEWHRGRHLGLCGTTVVSYVYYPLE